MPNVDAGLPASIPPASAGKPAVRRAIQANFDHIMGQLRAESARFNRLIKSVQEIQDVLQGGGDPTAITLATTVEELTTQVTKIIQGQGMGIPGIDGREGRPGFDGRPGSTGAAGAAGAKGSPGPPGLDGFMGRDAFTPPFPGFGPGRGQAAEGPHSHPGATITAGTTLLDFGAFPGASDAKIDVSFPGIVAGSMLLVRINPTATADHTADEHLVEELEVFAGNIQAGVGFTVYGIHRPAVQPGFGNAGMAAGLLSGVGRGDPTVHGQGTRVYGKWSVAYVVS